MGEVERFAPRRRAGARDLQRLPGAVRGGAAAGRAAAEHVAALHLPPGRRSRSSTPATPWTRACARGRAAVDPAPSTRPAATGRPIRCSTSSRPTARSCCATRRGTTSTARARDIAGVCNEAGNVVGLMPHPEHAVDAADRLGRRAASCSTRAPRRRARRMSDASRARASPTPSTTLIVEKLGREPNEVELAVFSLMWSEHCGYKHSRRLLQDAADRGPAARAGPGRERRRGRRRRRAGVRVQGRVAQPPERGRAVPGRGDRRRRHPARRLRDRRAADRDPRLAALRRAVEPRRARATCSSTPSPASATTATRSASPPSAARSTSRRPYEQNCLVNAMCVGLIETRPADPQRRRGRRQRRRAVRRAHGPRRDRRRVGAGVAPSSATPTPPSARRCRSATRSRRRSCSSARWSCSTAGCSSRCRTSAPRA